MGMTRRGLFTALLGASVAPFARSRSAEAFPAPNGIILGPLSPAAGSGFAVRNAGKPVPLKLDGSLRLRMERIRLAETIHWRLHDEDGRLIEMGCAIDLQELPPPRIPVGAVVWRSPAE